VFNFFQQQCAWLIWIDAGIQAMSHKEWIGASYPTAGSVVQGTITAGTLLNNDLLSCLFKLGHLFLRFLWLWVNTLYRLQIFSWAHLSRDLLLLHCVTVTVVMETICIPTVQCAQSLVLDWSDQCHCKIRVVCLAIFLWLNIISVLICVCIL